MAYKNSWTNSTQADPCVVTISPDADDFLIAWGMTDTTTGNPTPSGWTLAHSGTSTFDNGVLIVVYKVSDGTETSVSFSGELTTIAGCASFDGRDTTTPLDVAVATFTSSTGDTTTSISITPTTNGCDLVFVQGQDDGNSDYSFTFSTTSGTTGSWTTQVDQRAGFVNIGCGTATQTTAGALTAQCVSTSGGRIGVLFALRPAASGAVEQEGFRFRTDDGSETTATWAAAQDTNLTAPLSTNLRLRLLANATGDPAAIAYTLYHQKNGSGGYTAVPIVGSSSPSLSYGAAGALAYSSSGGTSVAPGYPSGITANSGLVLVIGQKPSSANGGTVTTPSGWTLQYSLTGANDGDTGGYTTTLAADQGNCNIFVYTKDSVSGSESGTLSVTVGTNNVCWVEIIRLEASDTATWSWAASGGKDTSGGNVSIVTSAGIDVAAGDYLIGGMVIPTDVTTPSQFSAEAFSQTGTTFGTAAEISEPDSGTGNDIGGFLFYNNASSGSGSGAVTMTATAGGTTTNVRGPGFVLRARVASVVYPVYVSASGNITAGGEATTAQLTAPSGKSTSDFVTGRMWDNENGTDTIDITSDDYTEVEWCLQAQSPAVNGDYFEFRVYKGSAPLDTYTVTPKWTIGSGAAATSSIIPFIPNQGRRYAPLQFF